MRKTLHSLLSLVLTVAILAGVLAVGGALPVLTTSADTPAYYVIDDCDTNTNFVSGAQRDTERKQGQASLRFGGNSEFTAMNSKAFQMDAPDKLDDWYLELWLYVDKTSSLTLSNCTLELNMDSTTYYRWSLRKVGTLRNGWNKIQVKLKDAGEKKNTDKFTEINRIKLSLTATKQVTVRLDDICLSREAVCSDKTALQQAVQRASTFDTAGAPAELLTALNDALALANEMLLDTTASPREVDIALEELNDALNAFGFDGFTMDTEATYGYINFSSMTYAMMDGFRAVGGEITTFAGRSTTKFTDKLLINTSKKHVSDGTKELRLIFNYYDVENGSLELQYGSTEGVKTALKVDCTGKNSWRTVTVRVNDAALARSIDNYDLALKVVGDATMYVSCVEVEVTDASNLADTNPPEFAAETEANNILGGGVFGYQMWFSAGENGWVHWGEGSHQNPAPGNGNHHTDMYPYVQDYIDNGAKLSESNLENLGNGDKAMLFTSKDPAVVETHFQWLDEYDLECMAIQRFGCGFQYQVPQNENHLVTAQKMAEKYNKAIYVMYDLSGMGNESYDSLYRRITTDWVLNVEQSGVASSTAYAHADGKPVVCIWGITGEAENTNYAKGRTASRLIRWFHERGYFVIIGSPDNDYETREGEYLDPYMMADMISPWYVGRYSYNNCINWIRDDGKKDRDFCVENGIKYQPVIFPGFSWIAMLHGGKPNAYPRLMGEFIWRQAVEFKALGVDSFYFAMFDEYDEGTAYMKGAADSFEIPEKDYFVTYAADGQWLSNDYYLRVAQKVTKYFKGETEDTKLNLAYSQGPIYWRNSFEKRWTTYMLADYVEDTYTILANVDVCTTLSRPLVSENVQLKFKQYIGSTDFLTATKETDPNTYATSLEGTGFFRDVSRKHTSTGEWAYQFNGTATGNNAVMKYLIASTNIMVSAAGLELDYSLYAANEAGRNVSVDLLLSDGTLVSSLVPAMQQTKGTVGEWKKVSVKLPASLVGKTITFVMVSYEGNAGEFDAYVDDIVLQSPGTERQMLETAVATASGLANDSDAFKEAVASGKSLLSTAGSTKKQFLAAMKEIDNVLREEGVKSGALFGDVNSDGKVTTADAAAALQFAAELLGESAINVAASDVNGDGKVTTADAALILQRCAELIDRFPVE